MLKKLALVILLIAFIVEVLPTDAEAVSVKYKSLCKRVITTSYPAKCINPTTSFDATDDRVWTLIRWGKTRRSHIVLMNWYAPNGNLYYTYTLKTLDPKDENYDWYESYNVWFWLNIKGYDIARMPGFWRAETKVDGHVVFNQVFTVTSTLLPIKFPSTPNFTSNKSIFVPYTDGAAQVKSKTRKANNPFGSWTDVNFEVDTGAAITVLPSSLADNLGINLKSGKRTSLVDVSGSKITAWIHELELAFVDPGNSDTLSPIKVEAAFAENDLVPLLLGRRDVLDQVEINFQSDGFTIKLK